MDKPCKYFYPACPIGQIMICEICQAVDEEKEEKENLIKILAKLYFAYENKDEDNPHKFELEAIKETLPILNKYGGMKELLKVKKA